MSQVEDALVYHMEWVLKKSLMMMTALLSKMALKVLVDTYSQRHLSGANIDYVESLMGSGFKINNPNVTKSCSCGHSFNTE